MTTAIGAGTSVARVDWSPIQETSDEPRSPAQPQPREIASDGGAASDATRTIGWSRNTAIEARRRTTESAEAQHREAQIRERELRDVERVPAENRSPSLDDVGAGTHVLMRGHQDVENDSVGPLQQMLGRNGTPLEDDGVFGPNTEGAVEALQAQSGLEVDGRVGDETLAELEHRDDQRTAELVAESDLDEAVRDDVLERMEGAETSADRRGLHDLTTSDAFLALDAAQQRELLAAAGADPDNAIYTGQLERLAGAEAFSTLDPSVRERTLEQVAKHTDDPYALDTIAGLTVSEGFGALTTDEQNRMLDYVGADTQFVVPGDRAALDDLLASDAYSNADAVGQAEQLRSFMTDQPRLPDSIRYPAGFVDGQRRDYEISDPTAIPDHVFHGSTEDALLYEVTIGGRTVPLYVPATQDPANGNFHTIDEIASGLAALPDAALAEVDNVTVNPVRNPRDPFWAKQYEDPDFESYMTAGDGLITMYPSIHPQNQHTLDGAMVHEVGHFVAHDRWGRDLTTPAWDEYSEAIAADGLDISAYGQNSETEDFAESFQLYMGVRGTPEEAELRAIYPNRFAIIDRILQGR